TETASDLQGAIDETFFHHLEEAVPPTAWAVPVAMPAPWGQTERGLIIAGPAQPQNPAAYCGAIATLAQALGWPVLADGLSPLRHHAALNPHLITTYDLLLRHPHHAEALVPEQVIQLGALPTSKVLRQWLAHTDPRRWIVTRSDRHQDPLHGRATPLPVALEALVAHLPEGAGLHPYAKDWHERDAIARQRLTAQLHPPDLWFEGKVSWLLPQLLPPHMPLVIANSMPVRDVEWFTPPSDRGLRPYVSRGANGIDGTLSTALGVAHHHGRAVLLTGDLALLHDSNGLLNAIQRDLHLTILLMNNHGGGIFESLPIAQFEPPFEDFFAMPQTVDFAALAAAHGVSYAVVSDWDTLAAHLSTGFTPGVRLLELPCDRKLDAQRRQMLLNTTGDFQI
ncbi:MAG TPA: thiamine pyrophosphate-dependent enzyme, partial [Candidatus Obscuribacterales bacterium]